MQTNEFDIKAKTWDQNAIHMERSIAIARDLETMVPLNKNMKAMEYGAGTGLLSFLLKDKLGDILMVDSSEKMISICNEKIASTEATNMHSLLMDLEKTEYHNQFDLIYSQMVFHHVKNVPEMLKKLYSLLNQGGYLAIADLYPEDGSFHGMEVTDVHRGFDPDALAGQLSQLGFSHTGVKQSFVVRRGDEKSFPVFLLVAKK